jgi:hypothetical protein
MSVACITLRAPAQRRDATLCAARSARPRATVARPCVASGAAAGNAPSGVPDESKRKLMNALLVGAVSLPGLPLAGGFADFFVPPSCAPVALRSAHDEPRQACGRTRARSFVVRRA